MTLNLDRPIPVQNRALCEFCNQPLDVTARGVHQYTRGWVMSREGGGGHGISLPEREARWAHRACVEQKARGTFDQPGLFR